MEKKRQVYGVNPETLVHDYLLGEYEIEKLKNGFLPPVLGGEPCPEHRGNSETLDCNGIEAADE